MKNPQKKLQTFSSFKISENEILDHLINILLSKAVILDIAGNVVEILKVGDYNPHFGPDFKYAILRKKGEIIHGDIEIDVRTSDWFRHGHFNNPHYNDVILHICIFPDHDPLRLETLSGNRLMSVRLREDDILRMNKFKAMKENKMDRTLLYSLLPCQHIFYRKCSTGIKLNRLMSFLGMKKMALKVRECRGFPRLGIGFVVSVWKRFFLFCGYPSNREFFRNASVMIEWSKLPKCDPLEMISIIKTVVFSMKEKMNNGLCRPANRPERRLSLFLAVMENGIFGELLFELEDIHLNGGELPSSWFFSMQEVLEGTGLSGPYAGLIMVNAIIPVICCFMPSWRQSVMEIYSNMEGMEDNHIIDRFGFMFPVGRIHKLKEIEMQGLLYMYHRYCCEDCSGCPVLSGLGSGIPIY